VRYGHIGNRVVAVSHTVNRGYCFSSGRSDL
jgi:hypothetical protein